MRKGSHHTAESKEKNRFAHLGIILTDEQKRNVVIGNKRINASAEVRRKKSESCKKFYDTENGIALRRKWSGERKGNNYALGYRHTDDAKRRMSANRLGQQHTLGFRHSDVTKAKVSVATKGEANPMHGKKHTLEVRRRLSQICKDRWDNWSDEERRQKMIQLGQHATPTAPELKIMDLLDTMYPNEREWVGNRVTVGYSKPDFKHRMGRNLLILEHGIYWHLWKARQEHPELGLTKQKVEDTDIAFYRQYGYDTLIIWEDELKQSGQVEAKIRRFCEGA